MRTICYCLAISLLAASCENEPPEFRLAERLQGYPEIVRAETLLSPVKLHLRAGQTLAASGADATREGVTQALFERVWTDIKDVGLIVPKVAVYDGQGRLLAESTAPAAYDLFDPVAQERERMEHEVEQRNREEERRDRDSFRRTGPWTASLCVMSTEAGLLGTRAASASLRVWKKDLGGWLEIDRRATDGLVSGERTKCTEIRVNAAGTYDIDVSAPSGTNFVINIRGGGTSLEARGSR